MKAWTEGNLVTVRVHDQLGEITTWFYFWEPELRLRELKEFTRRYASALSRPKNELEIA